LVVQVHLERRADSPEHQAVQQARRRTDGGGHRTALAKGEVGIRDRKPVPTLKNFAEHDFLLFVRSTFSAEEET
jgi:hypothetical protein